MDVFYKVKLILQNKNRLTDLEKKLIVAGGDEWEGKRQGIWDQQVHSAV